jgi:acetylglutamate kinase
VKVAVLKVGGASTTGVRDAVVRLRGDGYCVCVVHGAGPQISEEMVRRGLEVRFVCGRRFTTPAALEVVRESLAQVNAAICEALGADCVPLQGEAVGLRAERRPELGLVGIAVPCSPPTVSAALAAGLVPVVTPLAEGPLNVNADEAAAALAVGLGAARLLFLTDVPGVFHDGELLPAIDAERAEKWIEEGRFEGGIVPKLLAAARAARGGLVAEIGSTAVVA